MRLHPAAPVVLVQHDSRTPVSVQDVFDLKIVRSVLPMDLKLDVWLSVIRLVLRGGEYFPFAMFQSYAKSCPGQEPRTTPSRLTCQRILQRPVSMRWAS